MRRSRACPGDTVPVEDPRLLDGLTAGDLVKATLVVKNSNGYRLRSNTPGMKP
jgi:hypothetical protein